MNGQQAPVTNFSDVWTETSMFYFEGHGLDELSVPMDEPLAQQRQTHWKTQSRFSGGEVLVLSGCVSGFAEPLDSDVMVLGREARSREKAGKWVLSQRIEGPADTVQVMPTSMAMVIPVLHVEYRGAIAGVSRLFTEMLQAEATRERVKKDVRTVLETIPSKVSSQIEKWDLTNEVCTALRIIDDTYRTLQAVQVSISTDPEIRERKRIRITLTVSGNPEDVFSDELQYKGQLYSTLDIQVCELITTTYRWRN